MKNINVALLGFGTVGSGVAETIARNGKLIEDVIGCHFQITHVLVRHPDKYKNLAILNHRYYDRGYGRNSSGKGIYF